MEKWWCQLVEGLLSIGPTPSSLKEEEEKNAQDSIRVVKFFLSIFKSIDSKVKTVQAKNIY